MADVFLLEGVDRVDVTPSGGSLFNLPQANQFTMNQNIKTLEFAGDHTTRRIYRPDGLDGVLGASAMTTDLFAAAGVTEVTAGVPSGVASRFYPELGTYPDCQLDVYCFATDDADGSDTDVVIRVFLAKLQQYAPDNAGNLAVQGTTLNWSGKKTLTDIDGADLPGVSTQKVIYAIDLLA